ncbi:SMC-Scp complex subunit ScpB [Micromonospora sp. B11E3]|uniref:SMC-Scp complex subunit ScpB n=1 Tax=Micromonospora sp. B11E3 TaxID=3153562 RepID=UPI00325EFFBE
MSEPSAAPEAAAAPEPPAADAAAQSEAEPDSGGVRSEAAEPDSDGARSGTAEPDSDGAQSEAAEPDSGGVRSEAAEPDSDGARSEAAEADSDGARSEAAESDSGGWRSDTAKPTGAAGERGGGAGVPGKQPAGRRRTTAAPEPPPELDDRELRAALEAILLVVDEPVSELTLAKVLEQPPERVGAMLDDIAAGYTAAGHGFELRRAAGGWRLYTRPEYATYVERFVLDGQSVRLTQAALETLAVVAYKQPVTRSRISAIRGVNCDGVIRTLVSRGLVEECGTEPDSGAFLYRTTTMFLEKLGLNSVDELPPLAPFLPDDVEELADATR